MKHSLNMDVDNPDKKTKTNNEIKSLQFGEIDEKTIFQITFPKDSIRVILDDDSSPNLTSINFGCDKIIGVLLALGIKHEEK